MLKLYLNIKRLRKLHNMSQQELAEAVGYRGKSMIAQVESGKVDLSASMISKFAAVFNVSELELMGIEDDYSIHPDGDLEAEALELWKQYEGLSPEKKAAFVKYLKFLQSDT